MKKVLFLALLATSSLIADADSETIFTRIYDTGEWKAAETGGDLSGPGASLKASIEYINFLQDFIKKEKISTIVDLGCGDWAFSRYINWNGASYTGIDVVKHVVEKNQKQFSSPSVKFFHLDALSGDLPSADLLICKDVLQHLTNEDILQFLKQLPKFKHCLLTNDIQCDTMKDPPNLNIPRGKYRCIDLTLPPFNVKGNKALSFRSNWHTKLVLHVDHSKPQK